MFMRSIFIPDITYMPCIGIFLVGKKLSKNFSTHFFVDKKFNCQIN